MNTQIAFIGRKDELGQIDALIHEQQTRKILCIDAEGGIGKTRLLQEIHARYACKDNGIFVANIIDFDNRALHIPESLRFTASRRIGSEHFATYLQNLRHYRMMESGGVNPEQLEQEKLKIQRAWCDDFNTFSSQQRVVYLLDTTDSLKKPDILNYFITDLAIEHLNNALFIVAGRNAADVREVLSVHLHDNVQHLTLPPLEPDGARLYLQQKQELLYIVLEPELADKILFLSGGKPILLDLAIEWRAREIPLDWMVKSSLGYLHALSEEHLHERQQAFERQLVLNIAQTREQKDWLVLALSHVYPLSVELIAKLLNITDQEAQALVEQAKSSACVKTLPDGDISLHDEMRRMIHEYVWPENDPDGEQRRWYSEVAAEYFKTVVSEFEAQIQTQKKEPLQEFDGFLKAEKLATRQEAATVNWLRHALNADTDTGFSRYKQIVWKARNAQRHRFARQLQDIVRDHFRYLNKTQQHEFTVLHGRLLNDRGYPLEAQKLFEQLLVESREVPEHEADIYNALASTQISLGNLEMALEYQQKCLDILTWLNKQEFIPNVANQMGYIHRLRGELEESTRYYKMALDTALQTDTPSRHTVASVLNNLGYVLALQGKYHEGQTYCEQAIQLWEIENLSKNIGQGEIAIAAILRNRGRHDLAIQYLQKALARFEEPDDSLWLIRAYLQLGWTQWYQAMEKEKKDAFRLGKKSLVEEIGMRRKQRMLELARESFEKSFSFAKKYYTQTEFPAILGQYGKVCWLLNDKENAHQMVEKSFTLSEEIHDIQQAINCLVDMAEFDYVEQKYDKIPEYAKTLKEKYEDKGYNYPFFFGRMRRFLADIAFEEEQYGDALKYYAEGLALIKQHGGFSIYSIMQELAALGEKLDSLSPISAYQWITYLKKYWGEQKPAENYTTLLIWCDHQIVRTKFR